MRRNWKAYVSTMALWYFVFHGDRIATPVPTPIPNETSSNSQAFASQADCEAVRARFKFPSQPCMESAGAATPAWHLNARPEASPSR